MKILPVSDSSLLHGVVDLGTYSCLMLVGRRDERGEIEVVSDLCEVPRLGEGLAKTGALSQAGMDRTIAALANFQERARELGVASLFIAGTAAMRRAKNADVIVQRAREELGLEITVISELEEAEVGWIAATIGLEMSLEDVVVVDVGGGSTEVVTDGGRWVASFPLGGVVLTEAFATDGLSPGGGDWDGLERAVKEAFCELGKSKTLGSVAGGHRSGGPPKEPLLLALGGTASNLGSLELGLEQHDRKVPEGRRFLSSGAWKWAHELAGKDLAARRALPIEAERASVLPAGLACLGEVALKLGATELLVTGKGLRYGLIRKRLS